MNNFANYKNSKVTINTYRLPDALVTDVADILNAVDTDSKEILTASIDTKEKLDAIQELVLK